MAESLKLFSCPCQHDRGLACQLNAFFQLQYLYGHPLDLSTPSKTYYFQRLLELVQTFPADVKVDP